MTGRIVRSSSNRPASTSPTSQIESPRYEYGYDAKGNQTLLRDPLGRETWFTFDAQNRQFTRTLPLGFGEDGIRGTGDDPVGRTSTSVPPSAPTTTPASPVGWTSRSVLPADMPFTERMTYDALGRQHLHISFEGVVAEHVYSDTTGRLIEKRFFDNLTQYANGTGTAGEVWTYTHDAFGLESEVTQDDGNVSRTVQKGYDAQGRLIEVHTPEGVITYGYDALGHKTEMKVFAAGSDPLVDSPQRVSTYGYDRLGRLKTVIEDLDPADSENDLLAAVYSFDVLGNLARTDLPNGVITVYAYDPLNRLTEMTHYEPDAPGPLDPVNLEVPVRNWIRR